VTRPERIYTGRAYGHAGEFLQGAIRVAGKIQRVLISIPAPALSSTAIYTPAEEQGFTVSPLWKQKSRDAFIQAWRALSDAPIKGQLKIRSNIPVSRGMGSSTADCVSAIRAAASYFGKELAPERIAALAHQAECYSDATMFEEHLTAFDHFEGRVIEILPGDVPELQLAIIEPLLGASRVETDGLSRPSYLPEELHIFSDCLRQMRAALGNSDVQGIAAIAEISAEIDHKYHPKPRRDELLALARKHGALGVACAHSGDIQILLFKPSTLCVKMQERLQADLRRHGFALWKMISTRGAASSVANAVQV
jgi:uncharacterized protein involved in propanediol utilization